MIDRFAEKYLDFTPYQYAANNPINAIDINGDSIWYTQNDNIITMHVRGKLINSSSDNIDIGRAAQDIATGINEVFSGEIDFNGNTYTLQTDVMLEAVESMGDVKSSDHLFAILDSDGKSARGAISMNGGKVMNIASVDYANDNWFSKTFSSNNTRSALHEFGHAAGLFGHSSESRNLMVQKGAGYDITSQQRGTMISRPAVINRGPNSYLGIPYPYLHGNDPRTGAPVRDLARDIFNLSKR